MGRTPALIRQTSDRNDPISLPCWGSRLPDEVLSEQQEVRFSKAEWDVGPREKWEPMSAGGRKPRASTARRSQASSQKSWVRAHLGRTRDGGGNEVHYPPLSHWDCCHTAASKEGEGSSRGFFSFSRHDRCSQERERGRIFLGERGHFGFQQQLPFLIKQMFFLVIMVFYCYAYNRVI